MKGGTIVSRVVWATGAVSVFSAVALAATAAFTAGLLWKESESRNLRETAASLAMAIRREAAEDHLSLDRAAAEAIDEMAARGYRVEVWNGSTLIARSTSGRLLGPFSSAVRKGVEAEWLIQTKSLPGGVVIAVAEPLDQGLRTIRIFNRSLLLSLPLCLLVALVVGRFVGKRATRPLVAFTRQIARVQELRTSELAEIPNAPAEVRQLERSFRDLIARLAGSLSRELEFAGNASHELRTPLTRIRLHAERALTDAGALAESELRAQLSEIDQLVRLVDGLLVLAREVEAGIPIGEGVNLADLVRDCARRVFGDSGSPQLEAPDEAMVRGDESFLSIAVENLMDNARKYTPPGQRPRAVVTEDAREVRLSLVSPGVDLPQEARERLFDRFFRGDDARYSHSGHGLGLSLARHIAQLHGGDLSCENPTGDGVRFVLSLPRWVPQELGEVKPTGVSNA